MKKVFLIPLFLLIPLVLPSQSLAHMPGQPSFLLVNGKYADLYPWPTGKFVNLGPEEPQDIAPEKYQVNQPITIEIDFTKFPQVPPEQIKKTKFYWKFGDDSLGNGAKNTHAYTKPGKYVLKILADDGKAPAPQLFESIEITVEANKKAEEKQFPYAAVGGGILLIAGAGIIVAMVRKK